jgi:hypothetical protein
VRLAVKPPPEVEQPTAGAGVMATPPSEIETEESTHENPDPLRVIDSPIEPDDCEAEMVGTVRESDAEAWSRVVPVATREYDPEGVAVGTVTVHAKAPAVTGHPEVGVTSVAASDNDTEVSVEVNPEPVAVT